jgi:hypothetical protein
MAAVIVLVLLGQLVLDLTLANSRARAIEQRIAAQASALLPPASSSTNVVALLERQLVAMSGQAASPTLEALNSLVVPAGATALKLDAIDLQPGRATLQFANATSEDLASWRAAWSATGWQVSERSDPQGGLVIELVRP